jgi:hypothetical protein
MKALSKFIQSIDQLLMEDGVGWNLRKARLKPITILIHARSFGLSHIFQLRVCVRDRTNMTGLLD